MNLAIIKKIVLISPVFLIDQDKFSGNLQTLAELREQSG